MSRTARLIIGGIVAVLLLILIALVYIWVSGGSAAPSAPLVEATLAATEETSSTTTTFSIVTGESEVRFILDELLRGQLNTVTGRTDQIAGQIAADFATPSNSRVGEIRISARSLRTDSELRDRAIRSQILLSAQDEFEFISFVPTAMEGLPAAVTIGEAFDFEITGDLTIRDITQPVAFAVTVTPSVRRASKGRRRQRSSAAIMGWKSPACQVWRMWMRRYVWKLILWRKRSKPYRTRVCHPRSLSIGSQIPHDSAYSNETTLHSENIPSMIALDDAVKGAENGTPEANAERTGANRNLYYEPTRTQTDRSASAASAPSGTHARL